MEISKRRVSRNITNLDKTHELSALINADSFFYTIFFDNQLVLSEELSFSKTPLMEFFGGADVASVTKTRFAIHNAYFTAVPAKEFKLEAKNELLSHALGNRLYSGSIIRADYIEGAEIYLCYSVSPFELEKCKKIAPQADVIHSTTAIISSVLSGNTKDVVHLCKIGNQVVLVGALGGNLNIVNTFEDSSAMTMLYYVTLIKQTFNLDSKLVHIELSGDFHNEDGCQRLLSKYFEFVAYKEVSFRFDNEIITSSLYFPLRSIASCA